jgi:hypothetical protein
MKIEQLLQSPETLLKETDPSLLYVEGAITAHADGTSVRIYPDVKNKRVYWLVDKADIVGDLIAIANEHLSLRGLSQYKLFSIPIRHGAHIQTVVIEYHRLGETLSPIYRPAAVGDCVTDSMCSTYCCTQRVNGCSCNHCCSA